MDDIKNNFKKGERMMLEITVTDENLAHNEIVGSFLGKLTKDKTGFKVDRFALDKDKFYKESKRRLVNEIENILSNRLADAIGEIHELLK